MIERHQDKDERELARVTADFVPGSFNTDKSLTFTLYESGSYSSSELDGTIAIDSFSGPGLKWLGSITAADARELAVEMTALAEHETE